jgi:hypothetical protein
MKTSPMDSVTARAATCGFSSARNCIPRQGGGTPPEKPLESYTITLNISSTPGDSRVQASGLGTDESPWSIIAPGTLPRDYGIIAIDGETATERWRLSVFAYAVAGSQLTATQVPANLTPPQRAVWDLVEANWNAITATMNRPSGPADEPEPSAGGPVQRRFLNVLKQETDSNGNGIADWWELQYGYAPFSVPGESGYLGESNSTDTDGDGINDYAEGRCGLDPTSIDSDGDGTGDINEDSDADGAINQSELLNHSTLWDPDTDQDGLPDGPDWFELVDGESTEGTRFTPYEVFDPLASLPDSTARAAFRATVDGALPAYNNEWRPPASINLVEGEMLLGRRSYDVVDNDEWGEYVQLTRSRYRLRTGTAVAGSPQTVPILRTITTSGLPSGPVVNVELINVDITSGDVIREVSPDDFPADIAPYEQNLQIYDEDTGMSYVQTITEVSSIGWLRVDSNMDGILDLSDEVTVTRSGGESERLKQSSQGLILDINNNNSDAASAGSPTDDIHDHISPDLDGPLDEAEVVSSATPGAPGHMFGRLQLILRKRLLDNEVDTATNSGKEYSIVIKRTGDPCVRIHFPSSQPETSFGPYRRRVIGVPGDTGTNGAEDNRNGVQQLFPDFFSAGADPAYLTCDMLMEGVLRGVCDIEVEIANDTGTVLFRDKLKVQVNVDQLPDPTITNVKGKALAGSFPHFTGVDFGDLLAQNLSHSVLALRGQLRAEIPSADLGRGKWQPHLTGKNGQLRLADQSSESTLRGTASFWFGLNSRISSQTDPGCWVQGGLLFSQRPPDDFPNEEFGGQVRFFLETGRRNLVPGVNQQPMFESQTSALQGWSTRGIALDFVLFTTPSPSADTRDPWKLVCHDVRTPVGVPPQEGAYFIIDASPPANPDGTPPAIRDQITALHKNARYVSPEVKTELSNSAGFMFGNSQNRASIEFLHFATARNGPAESTSDPKLLFQWAVGSGPGQADFLWQSILNPEDPQITLRTGRLTATGSENEIEEAPTVSKYFWHCLRPASNPNKLEFYDDRLWAFPAGRRQ